MIIQLNLNSDIPIYQQLKDRLIEGIASGAIVAGEELPSVRRLAADLSINLHTVNKAYNQLKQEGFISVHRSRGAMVNPPESYVADDAYHSKLQSTLLPLVAEAKCRGLKVEDVVAACQRIYTDLGGETNES